MFGSSSGLNASNTGASSGFSFGASKPATTTTSTTQLTGGFSFGTPAASSAVTTAATTGNSIFGSSSLSLSKASASKSGAFNLLAASTVAPCPTLITTTSNSVFGSTSQNPQKTTAFKGLGGVDVTPSTASNNSTNGKSEVISQAVKDENVPEEICKDIKTFEDYIAKQKEESNEVGKFSVRSMHKITEEISSLCMSLSTLSSAVNKQSAYVEKLQEAFTKHLKHAEMAQCTQNTPPTLQHDNIAPLHYFIQLAASFDESMKLYRLQIDELENHLHSLPLTNTLTPHDISLTLLKMQETFVALASNLHSIHDNVKHLKEQYLTYRRIVHGDHTDIFAAQKENNQQPTEKNCRVRGLPPFQNLSNVAALAVASMMQPQQQAPSAPPQQSFINPGFGTATANTSLFAPKPTAATGSLFGAKPAVTSTNSLFGSSTFGASSGAKPPSLSAGNASTSSGNIFFGNSTFNSSAGVTFGGTATNKNAFDLKPPPVGSKRNKK